MILCHTWVVVFSYYEEICLRLENARSNCDLAAVISDKPRFLDPLRIVAPPGSAVAVGAADEAKPSTSPRVQSTRL